MSEITHTSGNAEKLKQLVVDGKKIGLAIDANVYFGGNDNDLKGFNVCLHKPAFLRLARESGGAFTFIVPDVWRRETLRHLTLAVPAWQKKTKGSDYFLEHLQAPEVKDAYDLLKNTLDRIDHANHAQTLWEKFTKERSAVLAATPPDCAAKVLDLYFNQQHPFETRKKDEFPDAIALVTLESYAATANFDAIAVVTSDDGAQQYCNLSKTLLAFDNLNLALDQFVPAEVAERRKLEAELSALFIKDPSWLQRVRDDILGLINMPYQHDWPRWSAQMPAGLWQSSQSPRFIVEEVLNFQLLAEPGKPAIEITEYLPEQFIFLNLKVQLKARVSCEVGARDTAAAEMTWPPRLRFAITSPRETTIDVNAVVHYLHEKTFLRADHCNVEHQGIYATPAFSDPPPPYWVPMSAA